MPWCASDRRSSVDVEVVVACSEEHFQEFEEKTAAQNKPEDNCVSVSYMNPDGEVYSLRETY
jgi:hypothetical protein